MKNPLDLLTRRRPEPEPTPVDERRAHWRRMQDDAAPSRYYGDGGTIHSDGHLSVEVHYGRVVAVWFRCAALPFKVSYVGEQRAREMERMGEWTPPVLTGVHLLDPAAPR